MTKKASIFLSLIVVSVVAVALWQFQTTRKSSPVISESEMITLAETPKSPSTNPPIESASADTETKGVLSEGDIRDINEASDQNIASPAFSERDYATYDDSTLQKMADSGDVAAMKALWVRYLKSDDVNDAEKMRPLVTKAIVYGDRDMFKHMPELSSLSDQFTNPEASAEEKRNAMLDILAYHEFMGLRGYTMDKYHGQENFFSIHSTPEAPIKLTEADKSEVLARAKQIYAAYEAERIKLGLGPFDNSVSEGQRKMFEMQRESYLQAMGENAI